jgi:hypothetical protein
MGAVTRMFTPSKSDNQSGAQYNAAYTAASLPTAPVLNTAAAKESVSTKRKRLTKTILTGPGGDELGYESEKKTLLGG